MKKRRLAIFSGVLIVILGIAAWRWTVINWGPWHHGKPLEVWLERYGPGPGGYKPSPETDEAIRKIGAAAVPYLLGLLHTPVPPRDLNSFPMQPFSFGPGVVTATNAGPIGFLPSTVNKAKQFIETYTPVRFDRKPDPPSWNHWKAYLAFQALGPSGKSAVPELATLAHDPKASYAYANVLGMKHIEWTASEAGQNTVFLPNDYMRRGGLQPAERPYFVDGEIAAWCLAAIGEAGVQPLMELLTNDNHVLRERAAEGLGLAGAAAKSAVPALVAAALNDSDFAVRMRAADALGCIGERPDIAIPALTRALSDENQGGVAYYAANSLGMFGPRATNAIPALRANLQAGDYRTRDSAALALSKISPETTVKEVIPSYLAKLKDPNYNIRNGALIALSQMKDHPDLVVPAIIDSTGDPNQMVRNNAIHMLGSFGANARAAIPKLTTLTNGPDTMARQWAGESLEKIQKSGGFLQN